MLFSFVSGVWVGVHTHQNPTVEEWRDYCARFERTRHDMRGVIVFTQGGGPSSRQREELRLAIGDTPVQPTAILSGSTFVRGIITSLNWFATNRQLAAFAPHDFEGALRYLAVDGASVDRAQIMSTMTSLAAQLRVPLPLADERGVNRAL